MAERKIVIIQRRPPYGDIGAAEALRHAIGAKAEDIDVALILVDSGVLLLKEAQQTGSTGFMNLGEALRDCIEMSVEVYAERQSLIENHIDPHKLLGGITVINSSETSDMVSEADATIIF